ncbi:DNA polymerase III subunit alpha [Burkholderiales bacterium]|nr:DNA polymerase III subunit alpha [Burkholderiales bacterium]
MIEDESETNGVKFYTMPSPRFVHLRLHSEYSVVDGIVRLDEAIAAAVDDGMPALALTDLANLFGAVKFYKAARGSGVKPILGCDVWIAGEGERDPASRLLLLVQNQAGYLRLCDWLSRAYRSNQHRGRAELRREWLLAGGEGLLALSGGAWGDVGQALANGNADLAARLAGEWAAAFPERYYLELQRGGQPEAERLGDAFLALAGALDLPVVATHPVQFLKREDYRAHEARVCIAEGYVLGDQRRPKHFTEEMYFKSQAEMATLFADLPEALANSVEIAKRCNLSLTLGKNFLPRFPTPQGVGLEDHLREAAHCGLERRLAVLYPDETERERQQPIYRARLDFETATIIQMGFPGYFLIVADFINWAKNNGVPVGPGRGSGAGSLVAYVLGITDLDPLRYQLLFERFLNPERVSMPDFDIDFCQDGRERVIEYVKQKYGAESVSQIATFGTMAAKAVVRDVGRVLGWGYNRTDELAKLIPFQPGKTVTLRRREGEGDSSLIYAREAEPQIDERDRSDEETHELLVLAEQLEGLTRNVGMHAGGVLIAPGKITDFCPVYVAPGVDAAISQFDKDDVEAVGLVKFDFLGLRTLTILDWAVRYIHALDPASSLQLDTLPLDDRATYELLAKANATAVFQLESRGMKDLLKQARPDRFEDIIALVALYRPGPMDLIPDFIRRKHGQERVEYLDPRLEPILGPTYGVMVYQEQVMQIAQVIGGYSLGGADLLRRAMGKKKPEEMAKQRSTFVAGATAGGVTQSVASQLFDLMEKFAGYGFNKSHAAAYALVAYHTAYLKTHHASAFLAATLSADMNDTDKVHLFYQDALANGLNFLPPDVNASGFRFEPVDEGRIRYGLGAIKGTGESAIAEILRARGEAPFRDLFDFCRRLDKRIVNRRVIEALVRAGAFDALSDHRAALLASVGVAMDHAEHQERHASQTSLFGEESAQAPPALVEARRWAELEVLQQEKTALGFYFSGHPFGAYRRELAGFVKTGLKTLAPKKELVTLAGIVTGVRSMVTKSGKMAFVTLDDGSAQIEVGVFSELYDAHRDWLKDDQLLIVVGKVREDAYSGGIRVSAEALHDLDSARNLFARGLRLACNGGSNAHRLMELLLPYRPGKVPVTVVYTNANAAGEIELPESWRIRLDQHLLQGLSEWLEPRNIEILY